MEIIFANIDFRIRYTLIVLNSHVAKLYPQNALKTTFQASSLFYSTGLLHGTLLFLCTLIHILSQWAWFSMSKTEINKSHWFLLKPRPSTTRQ